VKNQLTQGAKKRLMYVENKEGLIDGFPARIGWVTFSKTGKSVYYRGKELHKTTQAVRGNFFDALTHEEYWVSGVKKRGSNAHYAESISVVIDDDAKDEYTALRSK
jgi:hypothetical protein